MYAPQAPHGKQPWRQRSGFSAIASKKLSSYLNFGQLGRFPLNERDTNTQHEDGEPLHSTERTVQHQHRTESRTRDLQLVSYLKGKKIK